MANPLSQFEIKPLIPLELAGFDVAFTNSSLWMMIAAIVGLGFLILSTDNKKMVPNRSQVVSEKFYFMVRNMIVENTGPKGLQYFPLIFTTFLIVLMGNMMGLIPHSFTYTSHIFVTAGLAFFLFGLITIIAIINHGWKFLTIFNPPGVPLFLKPLVIPIEIISYFIRPVTLAVRLFANMMAGHLVLKVFAGFSVMMGIGLGLVPAFFNIAIYALEALVAALQAYVFAILVCIYFKDAVELHH